MPHLHLLCGKIASGKSTLAAQLAEKHNSVRVSEDEWLSTLYPDEVNSLEDFRRCTARIEALLESHLVDLLRAGVSLVLDFHVNTLARRNWMKEIIEKSGADHSLHILDVPDEICKQRLRERNQSGDHPYETSDAIFDQFSQYFVLPTPDEGFNMVWHRQEKS